MPERNIHNAPRIAITTAAMMPERISMGKIIAGVFVVRSTQYAVTLLRAAYCVLRRRCDDRRISYDARFDPERAVTGSVTQ